MRALFGPVATSLRERAKCQSHSRTAVRLRTRPVQLPLIAIAIVSLILSLGTGCCSPFYLAGRTLIGEPSRYSIRIDRKRSRALYGTWAEHEWQQVAGSCSNGCPLTTDYHAGFVDGFVDYVYAGGTGEPSPVPPRQYWNISQRSPNGKERVNQWFAGFRHGARVAQDGGYREAGTVQVSLAESFVNHPLESEFGVSGQNSGPNSLEEMLPSPRTGNPPAEHPSPKMIPRAPKPPNATPDNPFREDEPNGSPTGTSAVGGTSAQPPLNETHHDQVDDTPVDLPLPIEPLELPAAATETVSPLPPGNQAPQFIATGQQIETEIESQTDSSSRNAPTLAIVVGDTAESEDEASSTESPSGNQTTLVFRAGAISRKPTLDRPKLEDDADSEPAMALNSAVEWKSQRKAGEIRQPNDVDVLLDESSDNDSRTYGNE